MMKTSKKNDHGDEATMPNRNIEGRLIYSEKKFSFYNENICKNDAQLAYHN